MFKFHYFVIPKVKKNNRYAATSARNCFGLGATPHGSLSRLSRADDLLEPD
jgi:hypothetical protein